VIIVLDIDNIVQEDFTYNNQCIIVMQEDIELLQKIVWAEARGEDLDGQALVANVILNRLQSDKFPNSIEAIIYQENQFSPVTNGTLARATPNDETIQAVEIALSGVDNSQGALYFASGHKAKWHDTLTPLFKHGAHNFYI
jgi:N-acetylmuramoyl-L-alanine amidase